MKLPPALPVTTAGTSLPVTGFAGASLQAGAGGPVTVTSLLGGVGFGVIALIAGGTRGWTSTVTVAEGQSARDVRLMTDRQ